MFLKLLHRVQLWEGVGRGDEYEDHKTKLRSLDHVSW